MERLQPQALAVRMQPMPWFGTVKYISNVGFVLGGVWGCPRCISALLLLPGACLGSISFPLGKRCLAG